MVFFSSLFTFKYSSNITILWRNLTLRLLNQNNEYNLYPSSGNLSTNPRVHCQTRSHWVTMASITNDLIYQHYSNYTHFYIFLEIFQVNILKTITTNSHIRRLKHIYGYNLTSFLQNSHVKTVLNNQVDHILHKEAYTKLTPNSVI